MKYNNEYKGMMKSGYKSGAQIGCVKQHSEQTISMPGQKGKEYPSNKMEAMKKENAALEKVAK